MQHPKPILPEATCPAPQLRFACTPCTPCTPCSPAMHPSYPALMLLLPILQFWMFADYLLKSNICKSNSCRRCPQLCICQTSQIHLNLMHPTHPPPFGWNLISAESFTCLQGATGCLHSPVPSTGWGCTASQFDLQQGASKNVQDSLPSYAFPPHPSPLPFTLHFFNSYLHLITADFKTKTRFKLRNSYQAKEDEGGGGTFERDPNLTKCARDSRRCGNLFKKSCPTQPHSKLPGSVCGFENTFSFPMYFLFWTVRWCVEFICMTQNHRFYCSKFCHFEAYIPRTGGDVVLVFSFTNLAASFGRKYANISLENIWKGIIK